MAQNRCGWKVRTFGTCAALVYDGPSKTIEELVQRLRSETKKKYIDWHYSGGYARILCIGGAHEVADAAVRLVPTFALKVTPEA